MIGNRAPRTRGRWAAVPSAALFLLLPFLAGVAAKPDPVKAASCAVSVQTADLTAPLPRAARALAAGGPLRIVAIGSSSTAGAGASAPESSYPARLAEHLGARYPGVALTVLNKGVNGETGGDMLKRFRRDVLDHAPDLVIWQVAANTVLRGDDPGAAEDVIRSGVRTLKDAGLDVVLMDLQYAPAMLAKPRHEEMEARIARVAEEEGVGLFHRYAVMRQWVETRQSALSDLIGPDGIHQNDFGYDCVARTLAASLHDALGLRTAGKQFVRP
ncbi:GDSL-type esterase/lipase family protein [Roseomonas genomospecies 6]|uniref:SGNH/GDSL hydrolase family protein n=1 Tax=Roseomonas genomospecies 6 TaxID=214106 RepID=A0A9W7NIZ8_9PROT|nr:GDSL-type esterase/lipase family protein [Roseomonas genomospecies 6]KAA0680047.1 SGNH/GDSL hydrolase family protein [Roseomonas genomospecies 6]